MSLINFRNFLAPLGSKVQLGALLVLAFLAFVVRYNSTGGATEAPRETTQLRRVAPSGDQEELLRAAEKAPLFGSNSARRRADAADPMLEDALAGTGDTGRPPPPAQAPGGKGGLDEIRRTMGLE